MVWTLRDKLDDIIEYNNMEEGMMQYKNAHGSKMPASEHRGNMEHVGVRNADPAVTVARSSSKVKDPPTITRLLENSSVLLSSEPEMKLIEMRAFVSSRMVS